MRPARPLAGVTGALLLAALFVGLFSHPDNQAALQAQTLPGTGGLNGGILDGIGIFILLALNVMLSACEGALGTIRPHHVRLAKDERPRVAHRLQVLLDGRDTYVAACGLGSRIVRVGLLVLVLMLAPDVASAIPAWKQNGLTYAETMFGAALVGVPFAILNFALGELVPRAYGAGRPVAVLNRLYRFLRGMASVLAFPARGIVALANLFTTRFGGAAATNGPNLLEEEIKTLAESGEETGQIESDERELIHSVFEFADTVAREIMTPRVELDAMPVKSDPADVVRVIEETGHSRIPLFDETDDQILGVVHAKDLLANLSQGRPVELGKILRPVLCVPEGKAVRDLLQEMRNARTQIAVVQDEFGGTAGVVTIEDIVEELVGDIVDEYDVDEPDVVAMDGGWMINGKAHLDDVNEAIGSEFESEEFDTIGGFVFGQFGRQPKPGETIDVDRYRFTVTETDGRRVLQLRIEPCGEPDTSELDDE